ncbi:hypothetical protein PsYK624_059630 [Phanerochaete sordida]|uniref:Uncharacterized protein n=1 Tax=Phanerochaete sordida TaxID=48140 RepID=A0A9P3G5Z1_9APHY|nr:hypothetical protein PsYK624_059630 [Phanerochaete sordida]
MVKRLNIPLVDTSLIVRLHRRNTYWKHSVQNERRGLMDRVAVDKVCADGDLTRPDDAALPCGAVPDALDVNFGFVFHLKMLRPNCDCLNRRLSSSKLDDALCDERCGVPTPLTASYSLRAGQCAHEIMSRIASRLSGKTCPTRDVKHGSTDLAARHRKSA